MFDVSLRGNPVSVPVMIVGTKGYAENDWSRRATIERERDGTWSYRLERIPDPTPIK
jgi:hypothetical protein